jgi:hypothetical protein
MNMPGFMSIAKFYAELLTAPAPAVLRVAPNRLYPARDLMMSIAVLSDRSLIEEPACFGTGVRILKGVP